MWTFVTCHMRHTNIFTCHIHITSIWRFVVQLGKTVAKPETTVLAGVSTFIHITITRYINTISRQTPSRVCVPTKPYATKTQCFPDPNQVRQPEQNISTALSEYKIEKLNLKKGCNKKKCTVVSWFITIFFHREKTFWLAWPHDLHYSAADKGKFGHLHMTVLISTWYITDCEGS